MVALALIVIANPNLAMAPPPKIEKISEWQILNENTLIAPRIILYPTTNWRILELAEKIIQCESGGNNTKVGRQGEIGIAQFKIKTWNWMSDLAGFQGNIYSGKDQRWLLLWALENNLGSHWACYKKINL